MPVTNNVSSLVVPRPAARGAGPDLIRSRALSATTVLVAAFGEIDAVTATALADGIERHLPGYRQLVLDLSRLEFFGTAGYSVLHTVHARCAQSGIDWVLVPGPEVERLLRVCEPDAILPTAPNIVAAVAGLARTHSARPC
jgi:anti-anti-sigma factor